MPGTARRCDQKWPHVNFNFGHHIAWKSRLKGSGRLWIACRAIYLALSPALEPLRLPFRPGSSSAFLWQNEKS